MIKQLEKELAEKHKSANTGLTDEETISRAKEDIGHLMFLAESFKTTYWISLESAFYSELGYNTHKMTGEVYLVTRHGYVFKTNGIQHEPDTQRDTE